MFLIALTGGIAAGKSTVAAELKRLGAIVLDADQIARDVVTSDAETLARIVAEFGEQILTKDGALDRGALGARVFANPEELQALNRIVHPAVRKHTQTLLHTIDQENPDAVVIYDVPLLIEAEVDHNWDLIVVVMAPEADRVMRLIELRGMDEQEARNRVSQQASDEQRIAVADEIIDSGLSLESTKDQTRELWKRIQLMKNRDA